MKILVTGANGFVGRHLVAHLLRAGDHVIAADREPPDFGDGVANVPLDVVAAAAVDRLVGETAPDAVMHLAAVTFVPDAEAAPDAAITVNAGGAANLLHAVARHRQDSRFLLVSSAEVYGAPSPEALPLSENAPLEPINAYAASKLLAEDYARFAVRRYGLDVLIARPFTHVGPGQRPVFALANFAGQLGAIAAGRQEPVIKVGNLDARRDICDVRDVVKAYRLALDLVPAGTTFNVCSGVDRGIGETLRELISLSGLDVRIEVDPQRLRGRDIPVIRGTAELLRGHTGWRPETPWRETLAETLSFFVETSGIRQKKNKHSE